MYATFLTEDATTIMLPWKDDSTIKPVTGIDKFPTQYKDLLPFTDKLRVRNKKDSWFKMHFALDDNPENLTSAHNSATHYFFDDNDIASFLTTVQDSDDTIDLCVFLYSGPFVDPVHLTKVIQDECLKTYKQKLKFGCKARKVKEIKTDKSFNNWTMAANQPMNLEADKKHAKALKKLLYTCFNKTDQRSDRPGGYNFRVLPAPGHVITGSTGERARIEMLRKHQAVVSSLSLIRSPDIKHLDHPITINNQEYTLRSVLLEIQFPLAAQEDDVETPLFHTVDFASVNPDRDEGITHFTAYNDRSEIAQQLVAILPAYIDHLVGAQASKEWFHSSALHIRKEVQLVYDESGNWTGTWTTEEDNLNMAILQEDMGVDFSFENLDILGSSPDVLATADEASVQTFGSHFGRPKSGNNAPQDRDLVARPVVEGATRSEASGASAN